MKMDILTQRYFEYKFRNSELGTKKYIDNDNELWFGVWEGNQIIVGLPVDDLPNGVWYSNGHYFSGAVDLLNLNSYGDVHGLMKMFLEKKFFGLKIPKIL